MNLTPNQQKRVVTEFSVLEQRLDMVLFAKRDDDDDDGFPYVKTGLAGAGAAGLGYGGYAVAQRGARVNGAPLPGTVMGPGIGYGMNSIPGPIGPSAPKGFFNNLGTGAKAVGTDIAESPVIRNLRALLKGGVRKAAKAL
jgi:hypothetical protein